MYAKTGPIAKCFAKLLIRYSRGSSTYWLFACLIEEATLWITSCTLLVMPNWPEQHSRSSRNVCEHRTHRKMLCKTVHTIQQRTVNLLAVRLFIRGSNLMGNNLHSIGHV